MRTSQERLADAHTRLGSSEPVPITDLPPEFTRLVQRAGRVCRLLQIDAPAVILESQRRLLAESVLDIVTFINDEVISPAREACAEEYDSNSRKELIAHLRDRHDVVVNDDDESTLPVLFELHYGLDHTDHEDFDWKAGD